MAQKLAQFLNRGMMRDISISKASNEFAFENFNIRLTPMDKETLLTVTNEKGNAAVPNITINGYILGYCVLNRNLIIFATDPTADSPDSIYKVTFDVDSADSDYIKCYRRISIGPSQIEKQRVTALSFHAEGGTSSFLVDSGRKWAVGTIPPTEEEADPVWSIETIYNGNLKFRVQNPIETLGVYEAEAIQKVYWLDGINQPRVINIAANNPNYDDNSFDFLPTLKLTETVNVTKVFGYSGLFPSGVIQYAFTYSRNYGQESAIFYTTPLLYLTDQYRGLSAEGTTSCGFNISFTNIDTSFDRLNIYSIIRTSENGTPITKLVTQLDIRGNTTASFLDLNTSGEIIDPTSLLYKGGEWISAYTMSHKDNTLFLGNIKLLRNSVSDTLKGLVKNDSTISETLVSVDPSTKSGYFPYSFRLNNLPVSYMKRGEWYRLGLQFQDNHGKWSDPIFITDRQMGTYPTIGGSHYQLPSVVITPSAEAVAQAISEGYVKMRPVVVYPEYSDRVCLAQGVLNPTVFTFNNRLTNNPFAQASWFFRTLGAGNGEHWTIEDGDAFTDDIEGRDLHLLAPSKSIYGEVQIQENRKKVTQASNMLTYIDWCYPFLESGEGLIPTDTVGGVNGVNEQHIHYYGVEGNDNFCVDNGIITLNSPDLDDLPNESYPNLRLRIVGAINCIGPKWGTYTVQTETAASGGSGYGFYNPDYARMAVRGQLSTWGAYLDNIPQQVTGGEWQAPNNYGFAYAVYPWHRSGSLNNDIPGMARTAVLKSKVLSNITYVNDADHYFFASPWEAYGENDGDKTGIGQVNIVDFDEKSLSVLPNPENSSLISELQDIRYYGSEETLLYPNWNTTQLQLYGQTDEYGTYCAPQLISTLKEDYNYSKFWGAHWTLKDINDSSSHIPGMQYYSPGQTTPNGAWSTDPVYIKYKTTRHAVFSFNWSTAGKRLSMPLPAFAYDKWADDLTVRYRGTSYSSPFALAVGRPFWMEDRGDDVNTYILQRLYNPTEISELSDPRLIWIGELYKNVSPSQLFGGDSDFAIQQNTWYPCGEPMNLATASYVQTNEGDTFYQRWDCLKTYPFADGDQNSVVEILSFYVESYHNLDGRWDRNRGQLDNTTMSPLNFNIFNPTYNQKNTFFSYSILPDLYYTNIYFPNQITWTGVKSYGEETDSWTTINLASVLDMDGDKGPVEAIRRWNNNLIAFQDRGIAEIMYNSRTSLTTAEGTPIEVASSGKVEGKSYINDKIGCSNKWSIIEGKQGIYFIDDLNASINVFTDNVRSLSDEKGFKVWTKENQSIKVWDPYYFGNFRTYYDTIRGDVYFVNKETCLCFSEALGEFVSFYSYEDIPLMANVLNRLVTFKDTKLWVQNEGQYNMFYGVHQPYYVQHRITPSPYSDKIFNTVEYRADMFNANDELTNHTFDALEVDNEYQHGISLLHFDKAKVSNLKRKFRIWRANIPRDTKDDSRGMNRIRNPWINLKLTKDTPDDTERMEFHDLIVRYFE